MFVLERHTHVGLFGDRYVWEQDAVSNDELALESILAQKKDPGNWRIREVASLAPKGYVEDTDDD